MKEKSKHFRHESLQDTRAVVRYLNALAEGVEKGTLQFRNEQGEIVLEPAGMIRFAVSADSKSDRFGLTLKLSWKQYTPRGKDPGPLLINGMAEAPAAGSSSGEGD